MPQVSAPHWPGPPQITQTGGARRRVNSWTRVCPEGSDLLESLDSLSNMVRRLVHPDCQAALNIVREGRKIVQLTRQGKNPPGEC
jgi:hypothetical protein